MRVLKILCVGAGLLIAGSAWADQSAPDPQALGTIEALVGYCSKVAPAEAVKFQEQIKQLLKGQSEKEVAGIRGSDEYRKAYDTMAAFVAKVDQRNAKVACSGSAAQSQ
ncbi:MAG TPA: hypothetical protein VGD63_00270, partial [Steroidobacteraceae bacterium]